VASSESLNIRFLGSDLVISLLFDYSMAVIQRLLSSPFVALLHLLLMSGFFAMSAGELGQAKRMLGQSSHEDACCVQELDDPILDDHASKGCCSFEPTILAQPDQPSKSPHEASETLASACQDHEDCSTHSCACTRVHVSPTTAFSMHSYLPFLAPPRSQRAHLALRVGSISQAHLRSLFRPPIFLSA
jgi:hypothetical protein